MKAAAPTATAATARGPPELEAVMATAASAGGAGDDDGVSSAPGGVAGAREEEEEVKRCVASHVGMRRGPAARCDGKPPAAASCRDACLDLFRTRGRMASSGARLSLPPRRA